MRYRFTHRLNFKDIFSVVTKNDSYYIIYRVPVTGFLKH